MLGSSGKLSVIPPRTSSPSGSNPAYLVIEGLESALSIRNDYPDFSFLITNGKSNLKHVPEFLPDKATVYILSDHDNNEKPNQNGQTDAAKLRTVLKDMGYTVFASMSKEPKVDANDALREGRLQQWREEWIDVPELLEEQKPTEANLSELSHWHLDIKSSQVLVSEDKAANNSYLHPDQTSLISKRSKKRFCHFFENHLKSNVIINPRVVDAVHRMCLYTKVSTSMAINSISKI